MTSVSLVISTISRTRELHTLLLNLLHQETKDFEVVIVDQNSDNRLVPIVDPSRWTYPIRHIHTPRQQGLSKGRNVGLRDAIGEFVVFPDDDCWYPSWFLRKGIELLNTSQAASVTGRAADCSGRSINGRFESKATWVTRRNVWTTQIEWVAFFRRDPLLSVGGYSEDLGVGSGTPWGANEGQDVTLRLMTAGFPTYYDPSLYGFHAELNVSHPDAAMIAKGRSYARGFGYVLKQHRYGLFDLSYWLLRSTLGAAASAIEGNASQSRYYANVTLGRLEGWFGRPACPRFGGHRD